MVDDVADDKLSRAHHRRRVYLVLGALAIIVGLIIPVVALSFYIALTFGFILQPLIGMQRRH